MVNKKQKTVLVKTFGDRNYKVSFNSENSRCDFECFKESFQKVCDKVPFLYGLRKEAKGEFTFMIYDELFKCNVNLTEEDTLLNGSTIELFITKEVSVEVDEGAPQETVKTENSTSVSASAENGIAEENVDIIKETPASCKKSFRTPSVPYPCELPKLSPALRKAIEDGTIRNFYAAFIRQCSAFLLNMVEEPSKSDYEHFCRTVSDHYDFVNDKSGSGYAPYSSFKKTLSRSIRNSRYNRRRKSTKADVTYKSPKSLPIMDTLADEDETSECRSSTPAPNSIVFSEQAEETSNSANAVTSTQAINKPKQVQCYEKMLEMEEEEHKRRLDYLSEKINFMKNLNDVLMNNPSSINIQICDR